MPSFTDHHVGAVISAAISKYVYIMVNPKFDGRIRVSYSRTENVQTADELQHDIVRAALKKFQLKGVEIVSVSDIPGEGSGLGSSSSFTVGLLHALYSYKGLYPTTRELAEAAFKLEGETCHHPIGRQDPYAAAYGSVMFYEWSGSKAAVANFGFLSEELKELGSSLMLFWLGARQDGCSETILKDQMRRVGHGRESEQAAAYMADLARQLRGDLKHRAYGRLGQFVRGGWALKKGFSGAISNPEIEEIIERAMGAEAEGAKVCGAGGGGFLLVVADPVVQKKVEAAVGLPRMHFRIGARGSEVIWRDP
jgi:D-glycero-alpha-D-manno-heptose-7-phosphate kinase